MAPADAAHHELVNLLRTTLQEAPIILAIVMGLLFSVGTAHLTTLSQINVGILAFVVVLIQSGEHANHTLKQKQDVVEGVNLELLEERAPKMLLVRKLLEEG